MELNWTTFILEILNFLVLVWLLKRFFYQPVKAVVTRRQQGIEAQLQQADGTRREAEALRGQYENRLADWEAEREAARQALTEELNAERARLQQQLQVELEAERQKAAVLAERQLQEQLRVGEEQALQQGARFVARLLERLASPALESRMFALILEELQGLPGSQLEALQGLENSKALTVQVLSVWPLSDGQREELEARLMELIPGELHFEYQQADKLIAGLRISVGPWVLHANLHDELKTFAAIAYE